MEKRIGDVTHFYSRIGVAALRLEDGLKIGDEIHIRGHTTDFVQQVDSMEVEHRQLQAVGPQALVILYAVWVAANALLLMPKSPGLLAERATRRFRDKRWDNIILSVYGVLTLVKYIVAGLDFRFGWSPALPLAVQIAGLVVAALAYALVTWAMTANAYFALANRIQTDRGHTVATGGPYAYVRHPGYLGAILFEVATPIMLGSLWALAAGGVSALLMVTRTVLEDRTLHAELPGYAEFAQRRRYRFLYEKVCTLDVFEDCSLVEFQNMFGTTFSKLFQNQSNGELAIPTQDIDSVIQAVTEALTPGQRAEAFKMAVGLAYSDGVCDLEESILDRLRIGLGIEEDVAKQMLSVH